MKLEWLLGIAIAFTLGKGLYEVTHNNKQYVVNLLRKICGCRQWDMTGIPFAHQCLQFGILMQTPKIIYMSGI